MKSLVDQQREEVEKAVVGGGMYELVPMYESLQVKDGKWWRMHKFHTCTLKELDVEDTTQHKGKRPCNPKKHVQKSSSSSKETILGITTQLAQESTNLPEDTILGILQKA